MKKNYLMRTFCSLFLLLWLCTSPILAQGLAAIGEKNARPSNLPRALLPLNAQVRHLDRADVAKRQLHPTSYALPYVASSSKVRVLYASVAHSDAWNGDDSRQGIYSFPAVENTTFTPVAIDYGPAAQGGGAFYEKAFHWMEYFVYEDTYSSTYYECSYDDWVWNDNSFQYFDDLSRVAQSVAYDPSTATVYGCFSNADGTAHELGTISYGPKVERTTISPTDTVYVGMGCTKDGQLYAISQGGNLWTIDKLTGKAALVGYTGVRPAAKMQSAVMDTEVSRLYWAAMTADGRSGLYTVDLQSGQATKVTDFPGNEQVVALGFPEEVDENAPDTVKDLSLHFEGVQTTGTATFTMPDKSIGGSVLTAPLTYIATANADTVATASARPGEKVTLPLQVENGDLTFGVAVKAGNTIGKKVTANTWVGYDIPRTITDVKVEKKTDTAAVITWSVPKEGVHDAYVNPEEYVFDLLTIKGDTLMKNVTSPCLFKLPDESEPKNYQFTVATTFRKYHSISWPSDPIVLGKAFTPPYVDGFDGDGALFTILDANKDNKTWNIWQGVAWYEANDNSAGDDWLVTPRIALVKEREYMFSFEAWGEASGYTERLAVTYGQGNDPAAYATLMPETQIAGGPHKTYIYKVNVAETGSYSFAFHALSDGYGYGLYLDNISLKAAAANDAPAAVEGFSVLPAKDGTLKADISFTAPRSLVDGGKLTSLSKIEVKRDDRLIQTFTVPRVGEKLNFTDQAPDLTNGLHTYTVVPYNDQGAGTSSDTTVMVGTDIPLPPTHLKTKDNLDGTALLSWDAPTAGANGGYLDADSLHYSVYEQVGEKLNVVKADIKDRSLSVPLPQDGEQQALVFAVKAVSKGGEGDMVAFPTLVGGTAYELPFKETFAKGKPRYSLWLTSGGEGFLPTHLISADDEGGSMVFVPAQGGGSATLATGKIAFDKAESPELSFAYYVKAAGNASLKVAVAADGSEPDTLLSINYADDSMQSGWHTAKVDLSSYKDCRYLRVAFIASSAEANLPVAIDDIGVYNSLKYDMALSAVLPRRLVCGSNVPLKINVTNLGTEPVNAYKVILTVYDFSEHKDITEPLLPGQTRQIVWPYHVPATGYEPIPTAPGWDDPYVPVVDIHVGLQADNDAISYNNSAYAYVKVISATTPAPQNLAVSEGGFDAKLTWDAPAATWATQTEDFDGMSTFTTTELGKWTTIDGDGKDTYAFSDSWFPGMGSPMAFVVMNPADLGYDLGQNPGFTPHSGDQFLACVDVADGTANDDWLISPLLSGRAQTISLWAKAWMYGSEHFELLYSTTGTARADFKKIGQTFEAPVDGWTQFMADLPEGAKYFAVHVVSRDNFIFMLDDISYEAGGYIPKGYKVYSNYTEKGQTDVNVLTFTDKKVWTGTPYCVTAVYDEGESAPSDVVVYHSSGVQSVEGQSVGVSTRPGTIVVTGAKGQTVGVFGVDGSRIAVVRADEKEEIAVPAGLYLVRIEGKTVRIVVE